MMTMKYKGYEANIDYDEDADIFHGEVADLRDVVTFQGCSVAELKKAFAASIEDYLAFCKRARRGTGKAVFGRVPRADRPVIAQGRFEGRPKGRRQPQQMGRRFARKGGPSLNVGPRN